MLAFFWVELHGKNIIPRYATGKARRISAVTRNQILFHRVDIVTVDIVEAVAIFNVFPHGMKWTCMLLLPANLIPAHVRHLELMALFIVQLPGKAPYLALEDTKTGSVAFLAMFEQQLHPNSNT